ncbi:hypothetical protein [Paenibacillus sp. PL2-23]
MAGLGMMYGTVLDAAQGTAFGMARGLTRRKARAWRCAWHRA